MRNIFALIGFATIAFVGIGWYLDWYKFSRQSVGTGTQNLRFDINPDKTTEDMKKFIERGTEIIETLRDGKPQANQPAPAPSTEGPATQFFTPSSTPSTSGNGPWKSLETTPPPPPVQR